MEELLWLRLGDLAMVAPVAAVLCVGTWIGVRLARRDGPSRPRQPAPEDSLVTDLGYLLLSPVSEAMARCLTTLVLVAAALATGRTLAPELLDGFGPLVRQPRWLVVAEMLVLGDLFFYWTHRLAHAVPWLWRLHAVHHSTPHMQWSAAFRIHPGEAYAQLLHIVPLFLLGFPPDALLPLVPITTAYAAFIHSDSQLALRPVAYLFNSPGYHRLHHDREATRVVNFAGLFPFYDRLFGTYVPAPQRSEAPVVVGISDPAMPHAILGQLAYPFRRHQSAAEAETAAPRPLGGSRLHAGSAT